VTVEQAADGAPRMGLRWVVAALLAGAAASTLMTALAAAVAGRQADLALQPVELALRVALLLGAPCAGALLAALVVPRGGGRRAVAAVGAGVPVGPLLVLRLDRVREFGFRPVLVVAAVLLAWGVVGAVLAAGWWARPAGRVDRTELTAGGSAPRIPPETVPASPEGVAHPGTVPTPPEGAGPRVPSDTVTDVPGPPGRPA
jgi:hypothetical protein